MGAKVAGPRTGYGAESRQATQARVEVAKSFQENIGTGTPRRASRSHVNRTHEEATSQIEQRNIQVSPSNGCGKSGQSILAQKDPVQYRRLTSLTNSRGPRNEIAPEGRPPQPLPWRKTEIRLVPPQSERQKSEFGKLYQAFLPLRAGVISEGNITCHGLSDGTLRYLCSASNASMLYRRTGAASDILRDSPTCSTRSLRALPAPSTHSDTLDALTDTPESIVRAGRAEAPGDRLSHWLEKYRLGELWTSGELGGNRW